MDKKQVISEYMAELGQKGGASKSEVKADAGRKNLEKARAVPTTKKKSDASRENIKKAVKARMEKYKNSKEK